MAVNVNVAAVLFALIVAVVIVFIYFRYFKRGPSQTGELCEKNNDCENGACGRLGVNHGDYRCCPTGAIHTYNFIDYCGGLENAQLCHSDAMCKSGNCEGGSWLSAGVCLPKSDPGAPCRDDSECDYGCGRRAAPVSQPLQCCQPGQHPAEAWSRYFCVPIPDDNRCYKDSHCLPGSYCRGVAGVAYPGLCTKR